MHPGTHVWPHTGPTNCRLRMHLGLVIPKEGCKIRCANETRYVSFVSPISQQQVFLIESLYSVGCVPVSVAEVDRNKVTCVWSLVCDLCAFWGCRNAIQSWARPLSFTPQSSSACPASWFLLVDNPAFRVNPLALSSPRSALCLRLHSLTCACV